MNKIPLIDLKRQYLTIKEEIDAAIQSVLNSACFILGEPVEAFEKSFAQACGVEFGVGASSGTTALYLALTTLGIGAGDEVITTANTFIATTEAISQTGARVIFADINEGTYNIDCNSLEQKITPRTKVIVPVHLYGQSADMEAVCRIAKKHDLKVIEDASQAHLAEFNGQPVGSFGDCAVFSFYPAKNLGAYGDAGMVVTNDETLAQKMRMLSNHGRINKYEHVMEGYNYRLDTLQAAVLNVKFKYLAKWTQQRREIAQIYDKSLKDFDVIIPVADPRAKHVFHLYVIRVKNRERLEKTLAQNGISTGVHYPAPLHLQKAYQHLGYKRGDLPVTERCCEEILSLPLFPELTSLELDRIIEVIRRECPRPSRPSCVIANPKGEAILSSGIASSLKSAPRNDTKVHLTQSDQSQE